MFWPSVCNHEMRKGGSSVQLRKLPRTVWLYSVQALLAAQYVFWIFSFRCAHFLVATYFLRSFANMLACSLVQKYNIFAWAGPKAQLKLVNVVHKFGDS